MKILGDLADRFQLYAVCTVCDRMKRVRVQALMDRYGSDLTIDSVRRRLRCSGCKRRTGDIRIVYVGEQSRASGFHYRGDRTSERLPGPGRQPVSSSVDSRVKPKPSTPT